MCNIQKIYSSFFVILKHHHVIVKSGKAGIYRTICLGLAVKKQESCFSGLDTLTSERA